MLNLKRRGFAIALAVIIAIFEIRPVAAQATTIDLTPIGLTFTPCGDCTTFEGRGIYIRANESIAIDGVSWFGDVTSGNYQLVIWEGLGEDTAELGAQIALAAITLSGGVLGWNDIDVSAVLNAGQEYVVNLRREDGTAFSSNYDFLDWGNGPDDESDLGAVTLLDGRAGFDAENPENFWTSHFRFNSVPVPEPSTFTLSALGIATLAATGRRRPAPRRSLSQR